MPLLDTVEYPYETIIFNVVFFQSYSKFDMVKKASIFTSEDINKFLFSKSLPQGRYWLVRRAYVTVAYFGGLRCMEMHNIDLEDLEETSEGFYITINRTKQGGKSSQSKFLVPYDG